MHFLLVEGKFQFVCLDYRFHEYHKDEQFLIHIADNLKKVNIICDIVSKDRI